MKKFNGRHHLLMLGKRGALLLLAGIMSFASVLYSFQPQSASAAQLTSRDLTISTSVSNASGVAYDLDFTMGSSVAVQSMIVEFCTTPLGTCTLPNLMDIDTATITSQAFSEAATFTKVTGPVSTGACVLAGDNTDTQVCMSRTAPSAETATAKQIDLGTITNPTISTGAFLTIYARITLYSDTSFATQVHDGTVAAGVTQQLTTTGRVQERLEFCVAALDDATYDATPPQDCGDFPTTTSVDLGVIDNGSIAISPVPNTVTNPANDSYGAAMVNTNAAGGVVIEYFPEEETVVSGSDTDQLRSFRVAPTDCDASAASVTDQCFVSADGVTPTLMAAGTENFGMFIPCIAAATASQTVDNLGDNQVAAYAGSDGTMIDATPADCENDESTNTRFDFDDAAVAGTATTITSSNSVVDNEWLKIVFAATASATTPTGQYSVTTTYIATPTF